MITKNKAVIEADQDIADFLNRLEHVVDQAKPILASSAQRREAREVIDKLRKLVRDSQDIREAAMTMFRYAPDIEI